MFAFKQTLRVVMLISLQMIAVYASAELLSLDKAEQLALARDAVLKMQRFKTQAYIEQSIAADTLPDPRISLDLVNFPTDTFALDQEPVTQRRISIQQRFPRGDTLKINSQRAIALSAMSVASRIQRTAVIKMDVRINFLELLYWQRAEEIVKKSKRLFGKLVKITQSQYASGVQQQQDVIRASLELDMLDDRLDSVRAKQQQTQAKLIKLIGADAAAELDTRLPELSKFKFSTDLNTLMSQHPMIQMEDAMVSNHQYAIDLARQSYKPEWSIKVSYGFRDGTNPDGSNRADFATAMLSFDLPLFTKDKQDRQVAASQLNYQASLDEREEGIRKLSSKYDQTYASWSSQKSRLSRYKKAIVPQSKENAKAALYAYQSRRGNFTSLMRAQITELEISLKHIRLQISFLQSQAKLIYLAGVAR